MISDSASAADSPELKGKDEGEEIGRKENKKEESQGRNIMKEEGNV